MTDCATKESVDDLEEDTAEALKEIRDRLVEVENKLDCNPDVFKFGFIAGFGDRTDPTSLVTDAVAQMVAEGVEYVFFGGNNVIPSADTPAFLDQSFAPWQTWIDDEKAFPAYGNGELEHSLGIDQYNKFSSYIPSESKTVSGRYFSRTFNDGRIEFFVLNSGLDESDVLVEPDGNTINSGQYDWYRGKINNSCSTCSRKRFVIVPEPFVTMATTGAADAVSAMDWLFENDKVNILSGGSVGEVLKRDDMHLFNLPDITPAAIDAGGVLHGSNTDISKVWQYAADGATGNPLWLYIEVHNVLTVFKVIDVTTGLAVFSTIL